MTTITAHADYATLINVFTVQPERATRARRPADSSHRGSHAARRRLHLGEHSPQHRRHPGRQLRAMAQRRDALQAMRQDPTAREHMAQCADLADGFEPQLYTVESVHCRGHDGVMATRMRDLLDGALGSLRYEACEKRLRVYLDGELVADTIDGLLVWEPRRLVPTYAVPARRLRGTAGIGRAGRRSCRLARAGADESLCGAYLHRRNARRRRR